MNFKLRRNSTRAVNVYADSMDHSCKCNQCANLCVAITGAEAAVGLDNGSIYQYAGWEGMGGGVVGGGSRRGRRKMKKRRGDRFSVGL